MAHLTLALLGPFQATVDGRTVTGFPTEKARALLAYLAVEAGRPHPRATLAALLWPEMPNEAAMSNLRKTLHRLRQALDAPAPGLADRVVRITRQTVQFDVTMCAVDVTSVRALLEASAAHPHRQLARCVPCLERLAQAVALYRGELLSGLALADAPEFEEWLLLEREVTLQQALRTLSALADAETLRGAYEQAQTYAARQLSLDPCREEAYRQAMRALALAGQRSAALAQYAACRRLLDETLGVEPETETVALYRRIQQGRAPDGADAGPGQPPLGAVPLVHLPPQVTPFIGRARELRQIQERLLDPACRLLTVLGGGGMGKTRLSTTVVDSGIMRVQTLCPLQGYLDARCLSPHYPDVFPYGTHSPGRGRLDTRTPRLGRPDRPPLRAQRSASACAGLSERLAQSHRA